MKRVCVFVLSLSCCCIKQPDDLLYISLNIVICSYIILKLKPCNEQKDKWLAYSIDGKNRCKKIIVSWKCFECLSRWKITNVHARLTHESWILPLVWCPFSNVSQRANQFYIHSLSASVSKFIYSNATEDVGTKAFYKPNAKREIAATM